MSDMRELYQQLILDHGKRPKNFREIADPSAAASGHNPLCGDKIRVFLKMEGDAIKDVSFQGQGCAISTASASLMTESLKGKTKAEAEALFQRFHHLVTEGEEGASSAGSVPAKSTDSANPPDLGKLAVFSGVREFPVRVKCATLPWHTLHAALQEPGATVSTE